MATGPMSHVIEELRADALRRESDALSDAHLLERYLAGHEEAAFAALVRRHGPMIWGVCRRLLRDAHEAEDAFQATFLVLVQKAGAIRVRERLAGWLYGVAYHTARRARIMALKRRSREKLVRELPETPMRSAESCDDMRAVLDRELNHLPERYRLPLLLCDLLEKSHQEAAQELGWPVGTVSGRLSRGRQLLARRLAHRGLSLAAGTTAVLGEYTASAAPPPALVGATVDAARSLVAGHEAGAISGSVLVLMKGVIKAMTFEKLKLGAVGLLLAAALVGGILTFSQHAPASSAPGDPPATVGDKTLVPGKAEPGEKPGKEPILSDFGKISDGWQLTAQLKYAETAAGEPVQLTLMLRNASKGKLVYGEVSPGFDYFRTLTIKDHKGKDVPMTGYGKPWRENNELFKFVSRTLEPGQMVKFTLNLSLVYDLTKPGTYTITVKAPYAYKPGQGVGGEKADVWANIVQLKVVDPYRPLIDHEDWLMTKIGGNSKNPNDDVGPSWNQKGIDKNIKQVEGKSPLDLIGEDNIDSILMQNHSKPAKGEKGVTDQDFLRVLRTGKIIPQEKMVYHLQMAQTCLIRTKNGNYTLGIYYQPVAYIVLPGGECYWVLFGEKK